MADADGPKDINPVTEDVVTKPNDIKRSTERMNTLDCVVFVALIAIIGGFAHLYLQLSLEIPSTFEIKGASGKDGPIINGRYDPIKLDNSLLKDLKASAKDAITASKMPIYCKRDDSNAWLEFHGEGHNGSWYFKTLKKVGTSKRGKRLIPCYPALSPERCADFNIPQLKWTKWNMSVTVLNVPYPKWPSVGQAAMTVELAPASSLTFSGADAPLAKVLHGTYQPRKPENNKWMPDFSGWMSNVSKSALEFTKPYMPSWMPDALTFLHDITAIVPDIKGGFPVLIEWLPEFRLKNSKTNPTLNKIKFDYIGMKWVMTIEEKKNQSAVMKLGELPCFPPRFPERCVTNGTVSAWKLLAPEYFPRSGGKSADWNVVASTNPSNFVLNNKIVMSVV